MSVVESSLQARIEAAYTAFNARAVASVLRLMHVDVAWPNGLEGGYVYGHDAVRAYWERQWQMMDPRVEPVGFSLEPGGGIAVEVHQVVRDLNGKLLLDETVRHVYYFEHGLIRTMRIEK
jgi:SnoaL-like domain